MAAGLLCASATAQEGGGDDGLLRFLRPTVGPETEARAGAPQSETAAGETPAAEAESAGPAPPAPDAAVEDTETAAPAADAPAVPERPQPLRLGVLARRDAAKTLRALAAFSQSLGQALGRPVEFLPMASYGALIDAQTLGRIDGGSFSAAAYAFAQSACQCLEPLAAPRAADGTAAYHAVIVARAGAGGGVAELKGKRLAVAAADSVGGRRMPLAALLAEGIDAGTHFAQIRDVGSAEKAVRAVLAGEAEAAFAWSSLAGDIASGYSRGTLADLVARGEMDMAELAIVWRSPPISHGPFAVRADLAQADKAAVEALLLRLEADDPPAYDALNPFYAGGYAAVDAEDYRGVVLLAEHDVDAVRTVAASVPALAAQGQED